MHRLTCLLALIVLSTGCGPTADRDAASGAAQASEDFGSLVVGEPAFTMAEGEELRSQFEQPFPAWSSGGELSRYVFLHASEFWPAIIIDNSGEIRELTTDLREDVAALPFDVAGGTTTVADYVRNSPTDGVVVVHEGRIVFEDYPRMSSTDKHLWFSVSKTFVSTAVAILEDRGLVDASQPIDTYIEALRGTAWSGIPVVDILDMASGIDCPEVKSDPDSCFWEFYHAFGWPVTTQVQPEPMVTVPEMTTLRPSGEVFDYTSVNTEVLNWLVEEVSGERFSDFVQREIWQRTGAESDALITTTANGAAFSAGGVSSNLRDLARYGMLFTPMGRQGSAPVVSDAYMDKIQNGGRPELMTPAVVDGRRALIGDDSNRHNSYQWDVVTVDGDFFKGGFSGQGLYVSPSRNLVVVWFGTVDERGMTEMTRVARTLATSGLFGG